MSDHCYLKEAVYARRQYNDLFVCPRSFMFPWAVESSPLQFFFGASVTNLNEPPTRALAASTVAWVSSELYLFWVVVNKSNAG